MLFETVGFSIAWVNKDKLGKYSRHVAGIIVSCSRFLMTPKQRKSAKVLRIVCGIYCLLRMNPTCLLLSLQKQDTVEAKVDDVDESCALSIVHVRRFPQSIDSVRLYR